VGFVRDDILRTGIRRSRQFDIQKLSQKLVSRKLVEYPKGADGDDGFWEAPPKKDPD
jgi:hypothetical protein